MTEELFNHHHKVFTSRHGIKTDLDSRLEKLKVEVKELDDAILEGDISAIIKEAADCCIIAWHILLICGVKSPLFIMYLKLQEVTARPKYKALAERVMQGRKMAND